MSVNVLRFQFSATILPDFPITIPMRTHFLLEPAEAAGSGEKVSILSIWDRCLDFINIFAKKISKNGLFDSKQS
jgi:hypothetical protein